MLQYNQITEIFLIRNNGSEKTTENIFNVLKICQPRILSPMKYYSKYEDKINLFEMHKAERIHHQQKNKKHKKKSPLGRRNMKAEENLNLQK